MLDRYLLTPILKQPKALGWKSNWNIQLVFLERASQSKL